MLYLISLAVGTTLVPLAEVLIPVLMIASTRPRRGDFGRRAALVLALALAIVLVLCPAIYLMILDSSSSETLELVYTLASSIAILVCLVPVVMTLYETSIWQALFCAGAGYTIQNLASGTTQLLITVFSKGLGIPIGTSQGGLDGANAWLLLAFSVIPLLAVYAIAYVAFIARVRSDGLGDVEDRGMVAVLMLVILVVISFDVVIKSLNDVASLVTLVALRAVHGTVCCFVLFVQFEMLSRRSLELELLENQRMAAERERQYQLSRENIDAINVKCHDIRHQIRQLATGDTTVNQDFLADVEREVAVYDSHVETGNEALDTILTEKSLLCEREGISLSVIADGAALSVLTPAEVYSLFGNALDNAMEAVRALDDPDLRSISLTVRRVGELALIHVENYYAGTLEFADGLPRTTKDDKSSHGFGTRSMRAIVERHGGTLTLSTHGSTFKLDAMIPLKA